MKFTKKMRLVECEDDINPNAQHVSILPDDTYFQNPKVLYNLDTLMTEILLRKDLTDSEKSNLYGQALQKYNRLNYAHQHSNVSHDHKPRDSLDNITNPSVREFFENVRETVPQDSLLHHKNFNNLSSASTTQLSPSFTHTSIVSPSRMRSGKTRTPLPKKRPRKRRRISTSAFFNPSSISLKKWEVYDGHTIFH